MFIDLSTTWYFLKLRLLTLPPVDIVCMIKWQSMALAKHARLSVLTISLPWAHYAVTKRWFNIIVRNKRQKYTEWFKAIIWSLPKPSVCDKYGRIAPAFPQFISEQRFLGQLLWALHFAPWNSEVGLLQNFR